jgi:hypothetical protein
MLHATNCANNWLPAGCQPSLPMHQNSDTRPLARSSLKAIAPLLDDMAVDWEVGNTPENRAKLTAMIRIIKTRFLAVVDASERDSKRYGRSY